MQPKLKRRALRIIVTAAEKLQDVLDEADNPKDNDAKKVEALIKSLEDAVEEMNGDEEMDFYDD